MVRSVAHRRVSNHGAWRHPSRRRARARLLRMRGTWHGMASFFIGRWRRLSGATVVEKTPMTTVHAGTPSLSPSEHQVQLRRAVIASTIGTAIEWYDFFLYSTVTGLVFAKLFF